jgi:hypothetical protein
LEEKNKKQMMGTRNLGDDAFQTGALTGLAVVEVTGNKIGPGEVNCPEPGIVVTRSYFGYRNIIPSQERYVQNKEPETIYESRIGTADLAASRRFHRESSHIQRLRPWAGATLSISVDFIATGMVTGLEGCQCGNSFQLHGRFRRCGVCVAHAALRFFLSAWDCGCSS